jgi:hypothetical protein
VFLRWSPIGMRNLFRDVDKHERINGINSSATKTPLLIHSGNLKRDKCRDYRDRGRAATLFRCEVEPSP